jgi:hypothetical protein
MKLHLRKSLHLKHFVKGGYACTIRLVYDFLSMVEHSFDFSKIAIGCDRVTYIDQNAYITSPRFLRIRNDVFVNLIAAPNREDLT